MQPAIHLKPGREKPLLGRHPWIFSGAVARSEDIVEGGTVEVFAAAGDWLARGYFNSRSQINVRVWTWDQAETIDAEFFQRRIRDAAALRAQAGLNFNDPGNTNAFRLINGESDFLPGVIVDAYADTLVMQFLTLGAERWKGVIVDTLWAMLQPAAIFERSDAEIRAKEGLESATGILRGEPAAAPLEIRENGLRFLVDIELGHKTGFYLDQRENRRLAATFAAQGDNPAGRFMILNAFAYTGAFGVYCCAANSAARVLHLDESEAALELARRNHELNGSADRAEFMAGNAFQALRKFRDEDRQFDLVILDPPKFAAAQGQVAGACRGYKDINLLGIKLLRPGGILATFSCSGLIAPDLFRKVVFSAARDAGRAAQVLAATGHAPDHPWLLSFPEGEYLKGLFLRVS
jgi:23S rRNA (cytosine1962-C5)-methyltransferase